MFIKNFNIDNVCFEEVIINSNHEFFFNKKTIIILDLEPQPAFKFINLENYSFTKNECILVFNINLDNYQILHIVKKYFKKFIHNIILSDHNDTLYDNLNNILISLENKYDILPDINFDKIIIMDTIYNLIKNKIN